MELPQGMFSCQLKSQEIRRNLSREIALDFFSTDCHCMQLTLQRQQAGSRQSCQPPSVVVDSKDKKMLISCHSKDVDNLRRFKLISPFPFGVFIWMSARSTPETQ